MCSDGNSGQGSGTRGAPQTTLESTIAEHVAKTNDASLKKVYAPSPKHVEKGGWGSLNPITSDEEGQHLLDTGYPHGKQIYNVTKSGKIVKFQPANTPNNEYHPYEVDKPRDLPSKVRKQMEKDGLFSKADSNKLRKGKKKK